MYRPLVSVVIPVYNGSSYLAESIESALNQTYKNIEILVVNDGSNDNGETEKIALLYGDKIRYFSKENGGVSSALNLGIKNMKGEWFSWLSHDDLYYPTKIEDQIIFVNKLISENPNLDLKKVVVRCAQEQIDVNGKTIHKYYYGDVKEKEPIIDIILNNVYNYRLPGCSFLLPKDCFNVVGFFNEKIKTVSDAEYWYRLLFTNYNFYYLNKCLVRGRAHKKQVGKTKVSLFYQETNELHKWIADKLWDNLEYRKWRYFWRLGCYTRKRLLPDASKHAFLYAKKLMNNKLYYLLYPFFVNYYSLIGTMRTFIRSVYRMLYVK